MAAKSNRNVGRRIAAPVGRVWAIVEGFGALEVWVPAIKQMELEGHGVGSIRIAYLEGDHVSRERLLEVDAANHKLVYTLLPPSPLPLTNIRSTLQLNVIEPNLTEAVWYSQADRVPSDIATAVGAVVGGFYRENLAELNALTEKKRVVGFSSWANAGTAKIRAIGARENLIRCSGLVVCICSFSRHSRRQAL